MSKPLRLIYAGTPEFAVPALRALQAAGHEIVAVLTQPDRPAGRGQKLQSSPVKVAAQELGINVLQPVSLRKMAIKKQLRALQADVMVVAAYGLMLPQSVLDIPRLGCLNIHASLLPRWRGAAPIQRALEAGDEQTGITIMQMDAGLDTGDMLSRHALQIYAQDNAQTLHDELAILGADAIVTTLAKLAEATLVGVVQNDAQASYAHKLHKSDAQIDWSGTARSIAHKVRAFNPWPCAFTYYNNTPLRIWQSEVIEQENAPHTESTPGQVLVCNAGGIEVQTGDGILRLLEVQAAGRKRLKVAQFVNAHDLSGQRFASRV